jgi:hypothetical protein
MYVETPAEPIYHLAQDDRLTVCQLWLFGEPDQRRRRDDRRLVSDQPEGKTLCGTCGRILNGTPEPQRPSPELLSPHSLIDIPI